ARSGRDTANKPGAFTASQIQKQQHGPRCERMVRLSSMQGTRHRDLLPVKGPDRRLNQERSLTKVPR
ncbi:hypothetical protein A2U01_0097466, partial [Trifolium medium]|nr:hypothetical protein [Trifolium medium]